MQQGYLPVAGPYAHIVLLKQEMSLAVSRECAMCLVGTALQIMKQTVRKTEIK